MVCRIVISVFLVLLCQQHTNADVYASVAHLEKLWTAEAALITNVEQMIQKLENQYDLVSNYVTETRLNIRENTFHETPLRSLNTLRRITIDLADTEALFLTNDINIEATYEEVMNETSIERSVDNVVGAALGLARLQVTYKLKTADIAAGILKGKHLSSPMSADDVFNIGLHLFQAQKYASANLWLLHAKRMLEQEPQLSAQFPSLAEVGILPTLILSLIGTENFNLATRLNRKLSLYSVDIAAANEKVIKDTIANTRLRVPTLDDWKKKNDSSAVCSGEVTQSPTEQRQLRCRYVCNVKPNCIISPYKLEEFSLDPFVGVFQDVIYDKEIAFIKAQSINEMERSSVVDGKANINDVRTSKTRWMDAHDHVELHNFEHRMQQMTGLNLKFLEPLQVVNYGIGGHYVPHVDFLGDQNTDFVKIGDRILTALFYLNNVEMGGATAFPRLKIAVHPRKGSALVWYNKQRDISPDYRTLHTGCPVIKGSKWITNQWFHAFGQEFNRPCLLKQDPVREDK